MHFEALRTLSWIGGGAVLCFLIVPVTAYLFTGWQIRREKLLSYLGPDALSVYYSQFPYQPGKDVDIQKRFRAQFNYLYGRRHFVLPTILFAVLCSIAAWLVTRSVQSQFGIVGPPSAMPLTPVFAIVGGFVWILSDQLARIARRDVSPTDVHGWSFRLILSVPFGLAVAKVGNPVMAYSIAFFMGTFPTQTLFTFGRRIVTSKLQLGDDGGDSRPELCSLQSVSRANAEIYQDQGIETIAALAWADPVDLTIRTNFDFNFVLDCMSQALLWVYFEDKTRDLFRYSIRGSQEALGLIDAFDGISVDSRATGPLPFQQAEVKSTFNEIANKLGMSLDGFVTTLRQVAVDPYTQFIAKVWR